jgi:hypothetical protein
LKEEKRKCPIQLERESNNFEIQNLRVKIEVLGAVENVWGKSEDDLA